MHDETALVLTVLVLCYAVVSGLVRRLSLAPALVFMAAGMVLGPFGFGWLRLDARSEGFTILAQLALTLILFNQASDLDVGHVFQRGHLTLRLLLIGIPISFALGTLTAVLLLPVLPLWEAVCLAVIVAPTEVALIDALLEDHRIPDQVRHALSTESGFYDGFALAALLGALALASEHFHHAPARWAWFAFRTEVVSLVLGAGIGMIGALVISWSVRRGWMSGTWAQLATLALALICFGVGERLHASGFVTAFTAGIGYAIVSRRDSAARTQFSDTTAQLLELLVFAIFGVFAVVPAWQHISWQTLLFAFAALIVVRIIAVRTALIGSGLPARSVLFMGWFGPRGIGTLVLGQLVIARGEIQQGALISQVVVLTVTASLILHSLSTPVGIRLVAQPSVPSEQSE